MSKVGLVYRKGILAGRLYRESGDICFRYDPSYLDSVNPSITFSLPKKINQTQATD